MIIYPDNWQEVGQPISLKKIEDTILEVLAGIDCNNLSLSGGIDSTLLLYYLLTLGRKVRTFTITNNEQHPDTRYSMLAIQQLEKKFGVPIESSFRAIKTGITGDELVRAFYHDVNRQFDSIITGDGVDEYNCGYYCHQEAPSEWTYYDTLRKLQNNHLIPLNENSGDVKVYIPYIDSRLVSLFSQLPLKEKVSSQCRKKIIVDLAKGKIPQKIIMRRKYGFGTEYKQKGTVRKALVTQSAKDGIST